MTTSSFNSELFNVHPLDMPCVALAVITTGLDPARDRLLAVAAVKFQGNRELDRFSATVDSSANTLAADLAAFMGDAPQVGHNVGFALAFLSRHGLRPGNLRWDTQELASMLVPEATDASLRGLSKLFDGHTFPADDPDATANAARLLYLALVERAKRLTPPALHRMADLAYRSRSPLSPLLSALAETATGGPGMPGGVDYRAMGNRMERPRAINIEHNVEPIDPDQVEELLSDTGPLGRRFPRYEPRPEQVAMARAVADALNPTPGHEDDPHHLLLEGGTGIGKSVAYLLPAILFAVRNNTRVVISTNTISLQEQLVQKDIPDLLEALADEPGLDISKLRYSRMKGKANYLCLRRWEQLANSETLAAEESTTLAKTLSWMHQTTTGDRSELTLRGREPAVWDHISASGFSRCPGARDGACFYRHAREEAAAAHILVVNHALLLSDLMVDGTLLPEYEFLIVDEAHNLEDEATRQFGFRISYTAVEEMADRISNDLQSLTNAFGASSLDAAHKETAQRKVGEGTGPLTRARDDWTQLTVSLTAFVAEQRAGERNGGSGDGESTLSITSSSRAQPGWSAVEIDWDNFERAMSETERVVVSLLQALGETPEDSMPSREDLLLEFGDWLTSQGEMRRNIAGFVSRPDDGMVYWVVQGNNAPALNGAPLEVGPQLQEQLFSAKRTVVLASATMTVRGSFDHVRGRLGLDGPTELLLGSPFDYEQAALLCVPTDMPEPSSPAYQGLLSQTLGELAILAGGHTMALFTSHAALRAAREALRVSLASEGIAVLAQGVDGTPPQLLARFQEDPRAILLGTSSFWEGVDIVNNVLKVLVVARLPFNVPTEPVFAARSQLYENAFYEYSVPQAVLRFRQGFGRLIRNRSDRGAVLVLDGRISSKAYGKWFLSSLPPATGYHGPLAGAADKVADWLARPSDDR